MTVVGVTEAFGAGRAAQAAAKPDRRREAILVRLARLAGRRLPTLRRARTALLQVAGFGFLDYSVWGWNHLVGYAAVGASLLILEALGGDRR